MGPRRAVLSLIVVAVLAGCGDDDDGDTAATTDTQPEQTAIQQDAQAKANARNLATYVEACFVDEQDYSACRDAAAGEDIGAATVEIAKATTFSIVSPSESGNEFVLDRTPDGALQRSCTEPGTGGCPASGRW
jgi:hypothetical protein